MNTLKLSIRGYKRVKEGAKHHQRMLHAILPSEEMASVRLPHRNTKPRIRMQWPKMALLFRGFGNSFLSLQNDLPLLNKVKKINNRIYSVFAFLQPAVSTRRQLVRPLNVRALNDTHILLLLLLYFFSQIHTFAPN